MVSLLPSIDGRLFRIKGGNKLLPQRLITAANATLASSRVSRVTRESDGRFSLTVKQGVDGEEVCSSKQHASLNVCLIAVICSLMPCSLLVRLQQVLAGYDAVLVAVPLELANITIGGFQLPDLPMRAYQTTVTTLVQGRLRPEYFGVQALPRGVLL